jgi:hypothetical protein
VFITLTPRLLNLTAHANPTKILTNFQSPWKILKISYTMKKTRIITIIVLFLRSCGVMVLKSQVERLSGEPL